MVATFNRPSAMAVVCCLALPGCVSWRVQGVAPERVIQTLHPAELRVTHRDGNRVKLKEPAIEQDSLVGRRDQQRMAIALADVRNVAIRHPNNLGTLAIVLGTISAGLFIWAAATPW